MNGRGLRRLALLTLTLVALSAACAASRGVGADARFDAVRDTLTAMGLSQLRPPDHATIAHGGEARRVVDLEAGCVTFIVVGDEGVRDVDLAVLDSAGNPVAHDTTRAPQAIVRVCSDVAAKYTLVVTARAGGGSFTLGVWSGAAPDLRDAGAPEASTSVAPAIMGGGTCESPVALAVGETRGALATTSGVSEGSCGRTAGAEMVYELDVRARSQLSLELRGSFDTVLYVRRGDCAEPSGEIACNDDATSASDSRVDVVVDPGTYYVFVDGVSAGSYVLTTRLTPIPTTADVCRRARPLVAAQTVSGDTSRSVDAVQATCGGGAHGLDAAFRFDVPERERVRIRESSDEFHPLLHVRRVCAADESEVACAGVASNGTSATIARVLDPGAYSVFADGEGQDVGGRFTLRAETAPVAGGGTAGDACADAAALVVGQEVVGDTFTARDDVTTSCGAPRTPDVVYRVDIAHPSRVHVELLRDEGRHVLAIARACGDASTEIACAPAIDELLAPGSYSVIVEAATPDDMGEFTLRFDARDVAAEEGACKKVPHLTAAKPVSGTLDGAPDKFALSCTSVDGATSGDRVYSFDLAAPATVRVDLETPSFAGALGLRRRCVDTAYSPRGVEIECVAYGSTTTTTRVVRHLEAGTYFVVVEARDPADSGPFKLVYTTSQSTK